MGSKQEASTVVENFTTSLPNVYGALLASLDGRAIASTLPNHDPRSTAAIVASSRGLGERLAELTGTGELAEIVVRSASGYVVIYSVGGKAALTVLTRPAANLALIHLRARTAIDELEPHIEKIDVNA